MVCLLSCVSVWGAADLIGKFIRKRFYKTLTVHPSNVDLETIQPPAQQCIPQVPAPAPQAPAHKPTYEYTPRMQL